MAYVGPVRRWDIFRTDLDPVIGSEQRGPDRPVIVVSNDGVNASLKVVTVVSVTKLEDKQRKVYPFEVVLPKGSARLRGWDHVTVLAHAPDHDAVRDALLQPFAEQQEEAPTEARLLDEPSA